MENYNLHRRAQSGWHPTTYSRPVDKKPERNWAALMEAAKRKPVGYWADAPMGIQFGGGGEAATAPTGRVSCGSPRPVVDGLLPPKQGEAGSIPATAPSASSDEYEAHPDGKGVSRYVNGKGTYFYADGTQGGAFSALYSGWRCTQAQFIAKLREWNHPALAEFEAQPRKRVEGRVWKAASPRANPGFAQVRINGKEYFRDSVYGCNWNGPHVPLDLEPSAENRTELHGPEADAIIRECVSAMAKGATS